MARLLEHLYRENIRTRAATIGDGVEVRPSGIPGAGFGLFATRAFRRRELVTGVDGSLVTRAEADRLRAGGEHSHVRTLMYHTLAVDGLKSHPAPPGRGGGTYANDGRGDPAHPNNAEFVTAPVFDGTLPLCFLRARTAIAPGDEILVSYGRQYWRSHKRKTI